MIEEVENLIQLIDHKSQLQKNVSHRAGFRTRLEELQKQFEDLDKRAAIVKAFTERKFSRPDVYDKAQAVLTQVNMTVENFRETPDSIISSNNVVLKSSLKGLNAALEQYISDSWRLYTERGRQTNQQVLDGLRTIPIFTEIVDKVKILNIQIENLRKELPLSEASFNRFDRLVLEAEAAWEQIGSTNLPEEVEAFLRSAGSREGAPLNLLTTKVVEWLTEKGIGSSFRIHMKSTGN